MKNSALYSLYRTSRDAAARPSRQTPPRGGAPQSVGALRAGALTSPVGRKAPAALFREEGLAPARRFGRRRGAALIGMVTISFVLLSALSLVAGNIMLDTLRVQRWQAERYRRQQHFFLARSTALAIARELEAAPDITNVSITLNKKGTLNVADASHSFGVKLTATVVAASGADDVEIKVTAENESDDDGEYDVTVTCQFDRQEKKFVMWSADTE